MMILHRPQTCSICKPPVRLRRGPTRGFGRRPDGVLVSQYQSALPRGLLTADSTDR